jgi:hypothetical protein
MGQKSVSTPQTAPESSKSHKQNEIFLSKTWRMSYHPSAKIDKEHKKAPVITGAFLMETWKPKNKR